MTEVVVDLFEVVDVDHQGRNWITTAHRTVDQSIELTGHVAPVVQPGQLVDDGEFERTVEIIAQEVGVALALDLGAHAGGQFLQIDRLG